MTNVILVATSASKLKAYDTGLWIEELASPYYSFLAAGFDVTVSSPEGGAIPIDAASMAEGFFTDAAQRFMHDGTAVGKLSHSVKLSDLNLDAADAIYICGGHGACADFVNQLSLKKAIETLYTSGKVVASVCHGPVCFVDCIKADGTPLVSGLKVTGFSNTEEEAVQLTGLVPFLLEDKLKELGGNYEKGDDWNSKICVDGNLVTGQNPQSSDACADAVIAILK
eukprot:scaffold6860_cov297-Chaetoceros_neogracile.AAC.38